MSGSRSIPRSIPRSLPKSLLFSTDGLVPKQIGNVEIFNPEGEGGEVFSLKVCIAK